jgi:hypothetical protein
MLSRVVLTRATRRNTPEDAILHEMLGYWIFLSKYYIQICNVIDTNIYKIFNTPEQEHSGAVESNVWTIT